MKLHEILAEPSKNTISVNNLSCMKHFQNATLMVLTKEAFKDEDDDNENADNGRDNGGV